MTKKLSLILCILSFYQIDIFSQLTDIPVNFKDSIRIKTNWLGNKRYFQNDQELGLNDMTYLFQKTDLSAFKNIKTAKTTNTYANVTGFIGGSLIGWQIGNALFKKKVSWTKIGIGAGLIILVSIPLNSKSHDKAKIAIDQFNASR